MTYVYNCPFCGEEREHEQPITAKAARLRCPRCKKTMRRVITGGVGLPPRRQGLDEQGANMSEKKKPDEGWAEIIIEPDPELGEPFWRLQLATDLVGASRRTLECGYQKHDARARAAAWAKRLKIEVIETTL